MFYGGSVWVVGDTSGLLINYKKDEGNYQRPLTRANLATC